MYKFTLCFLISLAIGLSSCGSSSSDSSSANLTYSSDDGALQLTLPSGFIDMTTLMDSSVDDLDGYYYSGSDLGDGGKSLAIQTTSILGLTGMNQHAFCGQSTAELFQSATGFLGTVQLNSITYTVSFTQGSNVEWTRAQVEEVLATCPSS